MDDEDLTVWCGNLPGEASEELLYELFVQAAPLKRVHIPNDNKTGRPANYAFITFKHDVSIPYAISLLHGSRLYDKNIVVRQRNSNQSSGLPVRHKVPSLPAPYNLPERNKGSAGWIPYKENRRGGDNNKHHRPQQNRGNWGGHGNRYNDGNEQYGHGNKRRY